MRQMNLMAKIEQFTEASIEVFINNCKIRGILQ